MFTRMCFYYKLNGYDFSVCTTWLCLKFQSVKARTLSEFRVCTLNGLGTFYICVVQKTHWTTYATGFWIWLSNLAHLQVATIINTLPLYVLILEVLRIKDQAFKLIVVLQTLWLYRRLSLPTAKNLEVYVEKKQSSRIAKCKVLGMEICRYHNSTNTHEKESLTLQ